MKQVRIIIVLTIALFLLTSPISSFLIASNASNEESDKSSINETTILVTGFGPFAQYDINPSQLIAEKLNEQEINGKKIIGIKVPVDFDESIAVVTQAVDDFNPEIIICIGLEASTRVIHVEKIGINLKRLTSDNWPRYIFRKVDPDGPLFYISTLPTRDIVEEIRKTGIPAFQSCFGGTYICNTLHYCVLNYLEQNKSSIMAGFIHVPLLLSQNQNRGMELDNLIKAIKIAITVSLEE